MKSKKEHQKIIPKRLSKLAKQSLKNSKIELRYFRLWPRIRDYLVKTFSLPRSFFIILIVYCLFFFLHGLPIPHILSENYIKYFATLWAVQSGILAITVTVVVFIIQSINIQQKRQSVFNLFIRQSYIFPIVYVNLINIAGITVILYFRDASLYKGLVLMAVSVFLICILLIARLYSITFKFLDPIYIQKLRTDVLKKTFEKRLENEIIEKVAEALLLELCKKFEAKYNPFRTDVNNIVKAKTYGMIKDINIGSIIKILKKLDTTESNYEGRTIKATIFKTIRAYANEYHASLIDIVDDNVKEKQKKKLESAFKIKNVEVKEDDLQLSLNELSEEADKAIREGSSGAIKVVCEAFYDIFKHFSNVLSNYKILLRYSTYNFISRMVIIL